MNYQDIIEIIDQEIEHYMKQRFDHRRCPNCKASPLIRLYIESESELVEELGNTMLKCLNCSKIFAEELREKT